MASAFGAAEFTGLGFRDSYAFFGVKGAAGPVGEEHTVAGSGAAAVGGTVACGAPVPEPTASPAVPVPAPVPSPTAGPVPAPVPAPTAEVCADGITLVSAGFSDGNSATAALSTGGVDWGYDDSWMGRGFNVLLFGDERNTVEWHGRCVRFQ